MKKRLLFAMLMLSVLFGLCMAISIRADLELERKVLKSLVSPNGMQYDYYIPEQASLFASLPLLVVFHGGTMSLSDMEELTGLNRLADQMGFYVLYPFQDEHSNPEHYWNWFLPENQQRGLGEPARIIELMRHLPKPYRIDSNKTFALGFSAGGAMALTMQILYPDVFSGVAIAAGLPFASATNLYEAAMAMNGLLPTDEQLAARAIDAMPMTKGKPIRAILVHGLADTRVKPEASLAILRQLQAVNDVLDDGERNGSFSAVPDFDGPWMDDAFSPNRLIRYQNNKHKVVMEGYSIDGMTHRYPHPASNSPFAYGESMDFSLSTVFFLIHSIW